MTRKTKFNGKILKQKRRDAGYTQEELAVIIGISRETLSAIENEHIEALNALKIQVIAKWNDACNNKSDNTNKQDNPLKEAILKYFNF
jgi:HTH-type transcriptional regulator / antitoxin HipB